LPNGCSMLVGVWVFRQLDAAFNQSKPLSQDQISPSPSVKIQPVTLKCLRFFKGALLQNFSSWFGSSASGTSASYVQIWTLYWIWDKWRTCRMA
jgi:hypothetical protein